MESTWPVQDAKQRLSELLRKATEEGPQIVTKHGEELAVVIDIIRYRELLRVELAPDFKHALTHGSGSDEFSDVLDEIVAERAHDLPRDIDLVGRE
ncbi:type II toxin-antitoxin system Phd/YefM family antitoxin [Jiangella alkaliphila]|uniref:Antitoxin n=1 Tax=Jiangella alkaliphila TaxID=419479 RepID=A0A1H2L0D0_9ACTN|nr:type II toxin-antitoxin system Phd/YefM family antitoxin [Jiangella alkaliphila]SDU74517.1 prevent-host-death family protein [Jiangella alkaliphila]